MNTRNRGDSPKYLLFKNPELCGRTVFWGSERRLHRINVIRIEAEFLLMQPVKGIEQ